ncbi:MAG: D-alanyl-D-alanine carboxypeptidase [Firmicutes bacterium]|nr:D-alanyl-D-alanine carboxypeptidase [Bacillota bacterium]
MFLFGGMRASVVAGVIAVLIVVAAVIQFVRPVPQAKAQISLSAQGQIAGTPPQLPWPANVQATLDIPGIGSFGEHGPVTPGPIGSVAKMMTAYLVLKAHPLGPYNNGPSITVTPQDAALYQQDASTQQSVMRVIAGEKLTERKLLEGLLVASGNNIATMLADWVGGNPQHFAVMMNQEAKALGMNHTHYVGPSGLNPETTSTAQDQVKLAEVAMKIPVFAEIVDMAQMTVPGQVALEYNYNYLVGHDGIVGVKTGSTLQSGGCFVFAGKRVMGNQNVIVYGGVEGQPGTKTGSQLQMSLVDGEDLLNAVSRIVTSRTVIPSGEPVGTINVPWQSNVVLQTTKPITLLGWPGLGYSTHVSLTKLPVDVKELPAGSVVGTLTVTTGSQTVTVPVETVSKLTGPSLAWRMSRI